MSKALKCDKCGNFYEPISFDCNLKNAYPNGRPIFKITVHTFGMYNDLDICPRCEDEFREFMGRDNENIIMK